MNWENKSVPFHDRLGSILSLCLAVFALGVEPWHVAIAQPPPDAKQNLIAYQDTFAYKALVQSVVLGFSPGERKMSCELFMMYRYTGDLALIVLERSDSPAALAGLADLIQFTLDGAISEQHACAVLAKGERILPYLERARAAAKKGGCEATLKRLKVELVANVCADDERVERKFTSLADGIKRGEKCKEK
jgi:hypothetical protein